MQLRRLLALVFLCLAGLAVPGVAKAASWCGGTEESTIDRPDLVGGRQIRVVYVLPADGTDRFADVAPKIASDSAAIDAWWRGQDPTRTPRFDLAAFPGCPPGLDQLDIGFVRLTEPGSFFYPASSTMLNLALALNSAGVTKGVQESYKKTIVYYDGPVAPGGSCGASYIEPDTGGLFGVVGVYLQADPGPPGCGAVGSADLLAETVVFGLVDQFGGVAPQAPHVCPGGSSFVCDDAHDVMFPDAGFPALSDYVLDAGRDDYYGHAGSWLDVQDSPWLRHLQAPEFGLSVSLANAQAGDSVASDEPGIVCGTLCSTTLDSGSRIDLRASPGPGERFVRWTGGCHGGADCIPEMGGNRSVTAVFGPSMYRLTVRITGRGRVSSGFSCRKTCTRSLVAGATYPFKAVATSGWRFTGWTGACRGRGKCRVALTANRQLGATFRRIRQHS